MSYGDHSFNYCVNRCSFYINTENSENSRGGGDGSGSKKTMFFLPLNLLLLLFNDTDGMIIDNYGYDLGKIPREFVTVKKYKRYGRSRLAARLSKVVLPVARTRRENAKRANRKSKIFTDTVWCFHPRPLYAGWPEQRHIIYGMIIIPLSSFSTFDASRNAVNDERSGCFRNVIVYFTLGGRRWQLTIKWKTKVSRHFTRVTDFVNYTGAFEGGFERGKSG